MNQQLIPMRKASKKKDGAAGYLFLHTWSKGFQELVFSSAESAMKWAKENHVMYNTKAAIARKLMTSVEASVDSKDVQLAKAFSQVLKERLRPAEIKQMVSRNYIEKDSRICHSHDYCDANQAMIDAYGRIYPARMVLNQYDFDVMSVAWNIAKENKFYTV